MYDYDNREDFEDYGKHCWLLTPWKGYRSATIVGQTDKGYIVQVSSGACYIVNGDASGLTEEEIQTIDRWYKGIGVQVVSPVMDDECGTQPYFSHYPAFGLPTEVVDCDIYYIQPIKQ